MEESFNIFHDGGEVLSIGMLASDDMQEALRYQLDSQKAQYMTAIDKVKDVLATFHPDELYLGSRHMNFKNYSQSQNANFLSFNMNCRLIGGDPRYVDYIILDQDGCSLTGEPEVRKCVDYIDRLNDHDHERNSRNEQRNNDSETDSEKRIGSPTSSVYIAVCDIHI